MEGTFKMKSALLLRKEKLKIRKVSLKDETYCWTRQSRDTLRSDQT